MKRYGSRLIVAGIVVALVAVAFSAFASSSSTVPWYQCTNTAGTVETARGGTNIPTCGNKNDPMYTWQVSRVNAPPPVSTTTTSSNGTSTTVGASTTTSTIVASSTTQPGTTTTTQPAGTIWHPAASSGLQWYWQLQGSVSAHAGVKVYDIDGFDNTAATVASLQATGAKVVCYIDFGTSENFRSDFNQFTAAEQGNTNGWPGEKWLDIRNPAIRPIMLTRMQMCVSKGFDALEPDNIDGYTNSTGFPLTATDQANYNTWIATTAHSLGLSVALKNDVDQASQLEPNFDFAINEQCNQYSECGTLSSFTADNKAIFNAEYGGGTGFCASDIAKHINGAAFNLDLDGSTYTPCGGW